MNRLHSIVALFPLLFLCAVLVGTAQNQFTIDATKLPETPPRGRGPVAGLHSFTGHAELLQVLNGTSELIGTAEAEVVTETLSTPDPPAR